MSLALKGRFTPLPMQASIQELGSAELGVPGMRMAPTVLAPSLTARAAAAILPVQVVGVADANAVAHFVRQNGGDVSLVFGRADGTGINVNLVVGVAAGGEARREPGTLGAQVSMT